MTKSLAGIWKMLGLEVRLAEFPKGKVGVFNEMISVGIEIADQYYPIGMCGYESLPRPC